MKRKGILIRAFLVLCICLATIGGLWYFFVDRTPMTPSEKYNSLFEILEGYYFENLASLGIRFDKRKNDDIDSIIIFVYRIETLELHRIEGKRNAPSK